MALLAHASGSCLFFFPNCPRVWTSKASSDVAPRGSVGSDGEQLVERVPRRTALLRAGYGAGMVAVAGAGIGECAAGEARAEFYELEGSGGVKALDVRQGTGARSVQEFCRTFYSIRPDIALSVLKTIFQSDFRPLLPLVTVPCHLLHTLNDMAVPLEVAQYMQQHLRGWATTEVLNTEGHLPHLSDPAVVISALLRCLTS